MSVKPCHHCGSLHYVPSDDNKSGYCLHCGRSWTAPGHTVTARVYEYVEPVVCPVCHCEKVIPFFDDEPECGCKKESST